MSEDARAALHAVVCRVRPDRTAHSFVFDPQGILSDCRFLAAVPGWRLVPAVSVDAERLARLFHETYERLAPDFGYRTREASARPWDEVPAANRNLMIATCAVILAEAVPVDAERLRRLIDSGDIYQTEGGRWYSRVSGDVLAEAIAAALAAPSEPKVKRRTDWSDVVVDEGDEAP